MKEENTYHEKEGHNLPDYLRVNPFVIPEGYFDHFADNIRTKIAEQKLKQQVPDTGFTVPSDYFPRLEGDIQSRLFEHKLKDQASTEAYLVPEGYFEELTDKIKASVALERRIASIKEESFAVPTGYFETLSSRIMDKVANTSLVEKEEKSTTPVIQMPSKRKWVHYASAAAVAILIGIGSYLYLDQSAPSTHQTDNELHASLHELSKEDIVHYLAQVTDGVELIELASYMEEEEIFENNSFEINHRLNDKEIEEYLNYML